MAELVINHASGRVERLTLGAEAIVLGRDAECDLPLDDPGTSRQHVRISVEDGQYAIQDLGSKNGTLLNNISVTRAILADGDVVVLGSVRMTFHDKPAANPSASVRLIDQPLSQDTAQFSGPGRNLALPQQRLELLYELSERLTQLRSRDELLEEALDICFQTLRFERGAIAIRKPDGRGVEWPVVRNLYGAQGELTVSRSILARALDGGERAIINDADTTEVDPTVSMVQHGIRSAMCVPLANRDRVLGVIYGDRTSSGTVYTEEDVDFLAGLARQVSIGLINGQLMAEQEKKVLLENEMALARKIQKRLFPAQLPESGQISFSVLNEPGSLVSGDYYDVIPMAESADADNDERRIGFIVADVTGEGIAAALLMANLQAAVRVTLPHSDDLPDLLQGWNRLICNNTDASRFITAVVGILDPKTRRLKLICAGHPPPFLLRRDGAEPELLALDPCYPLGVIADAEFVHREIDLGTDPCTVFCYTDGVTEAMNADRQLYGTDRMVDSLVRSQQADPSQLIQQLRKSVSAFCGPAAQSDDITVLAVHLESSPRQQPGE